MYDASLKPYNFFIILFSIERKIGSFMHSMEIFFKEIKYVWNVLVYHYLPHTICELSLGLYRTVAIVLPCIVC